MQTHQVYIQAPISQRSSSQSRKCSTKTMTRSNYSIRWIGIYGPYRRICYNFCNILPRVPESTMDFTFIVTGAA